MNLTLDLSLWIAAGLLAMVALADGIAKTFVPKEIIDKRALRQVPHGGWVVHVSVGFFKTLGVLNILAAVGLILPAALDIAPVLVPVTAVCWVLLMVGAIITHVRYHDPAKFAVLDSFYLALAAFIAWGRFGPESFTSLT